MQILSRTKAWLIRNTPQSIAIAAQRISSLIKIEDAQLRQVRQHSFLLLVWGVIISTGLNSSYAVLRWMITGDYITLDPAFVVQYRNIVIFFLSLNLLGTIHLSRKADATRERVKSQTQPNRKWRIFEFTIIALTVGGSFFIIVQENVFYPILDLRSFYQSLMSINWVKKLIDGYTNLNLILLVVYVALKIPKATGNASTFLGRVYVSGRRVHESVIGLIWIVTAIVLIIYGTTLDNWLGILFLMFGMFLIGRDYLDVGHFSFLKDLQRNKNSKEEAVVDSLRRDNAN